MKFANNVDELLNLCLQHETDIVCSGEIAYLTKLDFTGKNLGDSGAFSLSHALRSMKRLLWLSLRDNHITEMGVNTLGSALEGLTNLQYLDLGHEETFFEKKRITILFRENNCISCREGAFVSALEKMSSLQHLDLSGNNIHFRRTEMHFSGILDFSGDICDSGDISFVESTSSTQIFLGKMCSLQHLDLSKNMLNADDALAFAPALEKMGFLQRLDIGENNFGPKGVMVLAQALKKMGTLRQLNLCRNSLGTEGAMMLAPALEKMSSLQHLDLGSNDFKVEGASALAPALENLDSLLYLDLEFNNIGNEGFYALAQALKKFSLLNCLKLGYNDIYFSLDLVRALENLGTLGHLGLDGNKFEKKNFIRVLEELSSLQHLDLNWNQISLNDLLALAPALEKLGSLRHLELSGNKFGAGEALALSVALEKLSSLEHLALSVNQFGFEGAKSLSLALGKMGSLQHLDLSCNKFGAEGAKALSVALEKLCSLQHLDLSQNKFGAMGMLSLAPVLEKMSSLQFLDLSYNQFGPKGALTLASALKSISSIRHLDLQRNNFNSEAAWFLAPSIKNLCSLEFLDFRDNDFGAEGALAMATVLENLLFLKGFGGISFTDLGEHGMTSLMLACKRGLYDAVPCLLSRGVPARAKNDAGETALDIASRSSGRCYRILSEHFKREEDAAQEEFVAYHHPAARGLPVKVIVVGSAGAGKTTLIRSLASCCGEGLFRAPAHLAGEGVATDGVDIWELRPPSEEAISLSVWDFGGQHVLYPTHRFFLTPHSVYVLVVDLACLAGRGSKYDAFGVPLPSPKRGRGKILTELKRKTEEDIVYWAEQVKELAQFPYENQVLVIGTHADVLYSIWELPKAKERLRLLLRPIFGEGVSFVTTAIGKKRRDQFFDSTLGILANLALNLRDALPKHLSLPWIFFKRRLERQRESQKWLWWFDFMRIADEEGVIPEHVGECAEFLFSRGALVTYRHLSGAAPSLAVLDPEWLTRAFSSVITVQKRDRRGIFGEAQLEAMWGVLGRNYPKESWDGLLQLLSLFQLVVPLPTGADGKRRWIVPCMILPREGESMDRAKVEALSAPIGTGMTSYGRRVQFRGGAAPYGFLGRLLVRLLHFPGVEVVEGLTFPTEVYLQLTSTCVLGSGHLHAVYEGDDILRLTVHCPAISVRESAAPSKGVFLYHLLDTLTQTLSSYFGYLTEFAVFASSTVLCEGAEVGAEAEVLARALHGDDVNLSRAPDLHMLGLPVFHHADYDMVNENLSVKGAFGAIHLVRMKSSGEQMVLKTLKKPSKHREFLAEALMMATLAGCPDLVAVRGVVLDPALCGLLLEYANGGDLASYYTERKRRGEASALTLPQALDCMRDLARGMAFLHSREFHLIHRDLRSLNVFFFKDASRDGGLRAKVADFGECVLALPVVGKAMEAWQWMAPEAVSGAGIVGYTQAMDVYSFAIVAWEMLAGAQPFLKEIEETTGRDDEVVKLQIRRDDLRPTFPDHVPDAWGVLLTRCWDSLAAQRPSFAEVVDVLDSFSVE